MHPNKLMDLDIRLGYKDGITLTRDEFKKLVDGGIQRIGELHDELGYLRDDVLSLECVILELNKKLKQKDSK